MMNVRGKFFGISLQAGALVLAFLFTSLVIYMSGVSPWEAYANIFWGSIGSFDKLADVLVVAAPLLLVTAGLVATFAAGLWNIGIEGQITMGAIFATWIMRALQHSSVHPAFIIILGILAGIAGGVLWAMLSGAFKLWGGVNEIFGGLGLNYVATAITLWLIFGPWKRPGVGSMSGTEPFPENLWMPNFLGSRMSLWPILMGIAAIIVVYAILRGTYFGLKLKAVGKNMRAAFIRGVPTTRCMMAAFALCGALGGLAGAVQVQAVYHRLIPSISSGYGFLGLLIALLVSFRAVWVLPVVLFFAMLNIGSIQLPMVLGIDSSLSGVIQGALVLFVLLMEGVRRSIWKRQH